MKLLALSWRVVQEWNWHYKWQGHVNRRNWLSITVDHFRKMSLWLFSFNKTISVLDWTRPKSTLCSMLEKLMATRITRTLCIHNQGRRKTHGRMVNNVFLLSPNLPPSNPTSQSSPFYACLEMQQSAKAWQFTQHFRWYVALRSKVVESCKLAYRSQHLTCDRPCLDSRDFFPFNITSRCLSNTHSGTKTGEISDKKRTHGAYTWSWHTTKSPINLEKVKRNGK